jgi:ABC-type transport system involved in Fe-S cluster assembly fused permease/ATPase subunit
MLFLSLTIVLECIIKLLLVIVSLIFGRNDNDEVNEFIEKGIKGVSNLTKYVLIGIFAALLFSLMVLDIIICVFYEKYILVALSIVIWILLYYILFRVIVKMIRKEIRL